MKVYPDRTSNIDVDKYEKRISNTLKNRLDDTFIGIHQVNLSGSDDDKCFALVCSNGLILVKSFYNDSLNSNDITTFRLLHKIYLNLIETRLKTMVSLTDGNDNLLVSVKLLYVFPNINEFNIISPSSVAEIEFLNSNFKNAHWIKSLQTNARDEVISILNINKQIILSEEYVTGIINRIAPWCTLARLNTKRLIAPEKKRIELDEERLLINDNDRIIDVLRLDDDQINYINNIKKGHQLILACAGSGKSVILISKCFKAASLDRSRKYLITCYNSNLADFYEWQIDEAGFRERNVQCSTFHGLCHRLLKENGLLNLPKTNNRAEKMFYLYQATRQGIDNGKIKNRFFGIFIDEVQVFEPEWYKLCYDLLENKETYEHLFVICGDLTQNVKKNIKRGTVPWRTYKELPSFVGRSKSIKKNYRNCIQINNFINIYSNIVHKYMDLLQIEEQIENDTFLKGIAIRNGHSPKLYEYSVYKTEYEVDLIIESIKHMHDVEGIPYTEIAILLFRQTGKYIRGWNQQSYFGKYVLSTKLQQNNIKFDFLSWDTDNRVSYSDRTGVAIMTNEGSLGLDFRGVIIAGIPTMCKDDNIYSVNDILTSDSNNDKRETVVNCLYSLYLGCTRAKDSLHVIVPDKNFTSLYSDILREAFLDYSKEFGGNA